jgi:hypothetical protein
MSLILELLSRGGMLLSKGHMVVHAFQIVLKAINWVLHSNVGLLGLDRVFNSIWP